MTLRQGPGHSLVLSREHTHPLDVIRVQVFNFFQLYADDS